MDKALTNRLMRFVVHKQPIKLQWWREGVVRRAEFASIRIALTPNKDLAQCWNVCFSFLGEETHVVLNRGSCAQARKRAERELAVFVADVALALLTHLESRVRL